MANARAKGKSGEYEVMHMLQAVINDIFAEFRVVAPTLRRNAMAYADGGEDLVGLPWYSIEVKRVEKLDIGKWWAQTLMQAASKDVAADEVYQWMPMPDYAVSRGVDVSVLIVRQRAHSAAVNMANGMIEETDRSGNRARGIPSRVPLLFYRQSRNRWSVVTFASLACWSGGGTIARLKMPADVSVEPWLQWFRSDLRLRLMALYPSAPATPG